MKHQGTLSIVATVILLAGAFAGYATLAPSAHGTTAVTTVSDVLAGRVPGGQDVTLEDTRVVSLRNDTCGGCSSWERRSVVTLEALSDGARIDAVIKKVGGNLLQYKKQNGLPLPGWTIRLSGTATQSGGAWVIDPAKEWVEFQHAGPTVTVQSVNSGQRAVNSYVWLEPVTVIRVFHSSDGDYHVQVSGGGVSDFTTEITPPHQDELLTPAVGDTLEIYGMILYDDDHDNWEIHPIRCLQRNVCAGGEGNAQPTPPGAPQNLGASAGDARVQLAWDAPASSGSSPITTYRVYRAIGSAQPALHAQTTERAYTDDGVTNGVRYRYAVSAVNADGEGPRSGEVAALPGANGATSWLSEDFETDVDAWTTDAAAGGSAWTLTDARAYDGARSITCGNGATYAANTDCTLASPALDLRRATQATLTFMQYADLAGIADLPLADRGVVEGSVDGGQTWTALAPAPRSTGGGWQEATLDLAPLLGASDARVRFRFTSDLLLEGEGWFVDAASVTGIRAPPGAPTGLQAARNADASVRLAWTAPADAGPATIYVVYRGATASALTYYRDGTTATTFTDATPDDAKRWYAVAALDGQEGPRSEAVQAPGSTPPPPPPPGDVLFEDDFEPDAVAGWTIVKRGPTGSSKWNLKTTQSVSPTHSYTPGGGTSYGPNTDADLISPAISLGDATAPKLKFHHKVGGEANRDYGRVYVSADQGATWTQIGGPYHGVSSWAQVTLDLPPGASAVQVKFTFVSDNNGVQNAAWFVDDVEVTAT